MPLLRGVVTMVAMLAIGCRALRCSADEAIDDAEDRKGERDAPARKDGKGGNSDLAMGFGMSLALLLGVGLFFWLHLAVTRWAGALLPAPSGRLVLHVG